MVWLTARAVVSNLYFIIPRAGREMGEEGYISSFYFLVQGFEFGILHLPY
jgi:hypothetical protein